MDIDNHTRSFESKTSSLIKPKYNHINQINLVDEVKKLNTCKLCYIKYKSKEKLNRHEIYDHIQDQKELKMTTITISAQGLNF